MRKNEQITSENDLLQLPDIDGLVRDIKQQETIKNTEEESKDTDFWSMFMQCSEQYEYHKKIADRRAVLVDVEIIDTLKNCDINKMPVCTIVNAVMRSFIAQHQDILRQHTPKRNSLI